MPLQIGARDVAFPRLNAFSFWTFLVGAIIVLIWFCKKGTEGANRFGEPVLPVLDAPANPA